MVIILNNKLMERKLFVVICLLMAGLMKVQAATADDWKPVTGSKAVAFVEEFYTHRSMKNGTWEDAVLEQHLAPQVLKQLADAAANAEAKYASWLLSALDDSEMLLPSIRTHEPTATADGRVAVDLEIFYWADTGLRSTQTLYFTVKSKGGRMMITQVDGLNGDAAEEVWAQLEARNEAREMESEMEVEADDPLQRFEGNIGPYPVTLFLNPGDVGVGNTVGNYYYNERPNSVFTLELVKNEAINTKGSMHIVLKEFTSNGNHTGTFDGQYECRGGGFEGTFTTTKGKKFKFELMEKN